jgi:hypothetical protein
MVPDSRCAIFLEQIIRRYCAVRASTSYHLNSFNVRSLAHFGFCIEDDAMTCRVRHVVHAREALVPRRMRTPSLLYGFGRIGAWVVMAVLMRDT